VTAPDRAESRQDCADCAAQPDARPWAPLPPDAQHAALQRLRLYAEERVAIARAELARAERDLALYEAVAGPRPPGDTECLSDDAEHSESDHLHTPDDPADAGPVESPGPPRIPDRRAEESAMDRKEYIEAVVSAVRSYLSARHGEWYTVADMVKALGGGSTRDVGRVVASAHADGRLPGVERACKDGHVSMWRMVPREGVAEPRTWKRDPRDVARLAEAARLLSRGVHPRHGFPGAIGDTLRRLAAAALHASPPPAGAGYSAHGLLDAAASLGWIPAEQTGPLEPAMRSALVSGADGVHVVDAVGTTAYRPS